MSVSELALQSENSLNKLFPLHFFTNPLLIITRKIKNYFVTTNYNRMCDQDVKSSLTFLAKLIQVLYLV